MYGVGTAAAARSPPALTPDRRQVAKRQLTAEPSPPTAALADSVRAAPRCSATPCARHCAALTSAAAAAQIMRNARRASSDDDDYTRSRGQPPPSLPPSDFLHFSDDDGLGSFGGSGGELRAPGAPPRHMDKLRRILWLRIVVKVENCG